MKNLNAFYVDLPNWCDNKNSIHRQFFGNFLFCLHDEYLPIKLNPIKFPCYGLRRPAIKRTIIFSFHTYDNDQNVWSIKESPIYGLYSIDKKGYSGWSDICVNFHDYLGEINKISVSDAESIINKKKIFFDESKLSKYEQSENKINLPSDYIFFPMQVNSDSVTDHENISASDALDYAAKMAEKTNRFLVVKRHPFCQSKAIDYKVKYLSATNRNILFVDANVHDLINSCSAVLACNSGVTIEALIAGKPVFCFGKSEWYEATNKIEKLEDIESVFTEKKYKPISELGKKILAYLLSEYWVEYDNIEHIKRKIKDCINLYEDDYGDDFLSEIIDENKYIQNFLVAQNKIAVMERKQKKYKKDYEMFKFLVRFVLYAPFELICKIKDKR